MTKRKLPTEPQKRVRRPLRAVALRNRPVDIPGLGTRYRRWPAVAAAELSRSAEGHLRAILDEARATLKKKALQARRSLDDQAIDRAIERSLAHAFHWAAGQAKLREVSAHDNRRPWTGGPLYLRVQYQRGAVREQVCRGMEAIASGVSGTLVEDPSSSEFLSEMYRGHSQGLGSLEDTGFDALDPHAIATIVERTKSLPAGTSARGVARMAADALLSLAGPQCVRGRQSNARDGLAVGIAAQWRDLGIQPGMSTTSDGRREGPFPRYVRLIASAVGFAGAGIEGLGDNAIRRALAMLKT